MIPSLTNDIPAKQLQPELVALLRARYRTYRIAKLTQALFVLLTIALPVTSVFLATAYPQVKPYLAFAAIVLLLLDTGIIDRLQKDRTKRGAKLQEVHHIATLGSGLAFCLYRTSLNHVPLPAHRISRSDLPRYLAW